MGILVMPPEIILHVLEGMTVQDVINVAQTCQLLRDIVLSNKQAIANTRDRCAVSLPLGYASKTISGPELYAAAARSVAVSKRFSSSKKSLKPRSEQFCDLCSLTLPWGREHYPSNFYLREDVLAFQFRSSVSVIKLDSPTHILTSIRFKNEDASAYKVAYQMSDSGDTLIIAALAIDRSEDIQGEFLQVMEVSLAEETFGRTLSDFQIGMPGGTETVHLRDPYIVLNLHSGRCRIVDWRARTGITFAVLDDMPAQEEDEIEFEELDIDTIYIHPNDPMILIVDSHWNTMIFFIDIPTDMPRLTHWASYDSSHWNKRQIAPREAPRPQFPWSERLDSRIVISGLRSISPTTQVLDFLTTEEVEDDLITTPDRRLIHKTIVSRMSLNITDWTMRSERIKMNSKVLINPDFRLLGSDVAAEGLFSMAIWVGQSQTLIAPKFNDGPGHGDNSSRVKLLLPKCLTAPRYSTSKDHAGKRLNNQLLVPTFFDVRQGILYVFIDTGFHIVHY
ncbi:hypothetical protein SISNIDRAFT_550338 [Sistotremastrum niveocremeum HHB9708]|uniref:F-box domain-containing protein n=1 Tax=Sistotremastrum niveocremeum HHB9708 TaxID=1314777 RepID=A0A164U102_9AGAM|nr:hypothetical protein SISNIDRAFT_550338 [Sistotremastrum niveocremeum HHB9708]